MKGFRDDSEVSTNSTTTDEDVFPLPLSPFERYMVLDDTDAYPMSFVLIVRLKGNLQQEVFEESVVFALRRHPLLMSTIRKVGGQGWCWTPVDNPSQIGRAHV